MKFQVNGEDVYAATGNRELNPDCETVVFIHGTGQDHSIWVLPTRYFARHGKNVLAIDLPGHGRSSGSPIKTVEAMADWVISVLDEAGLPNAAMAGHSLGSLVAIAAAARHPQRVRAIALIGVTVPMPVSEHLLARAQENSHEAIDMLCFWGLSKSAQMGGNATPGNWMLGGGIRLMEKAGPGVIFTDLTACNQYHDGLIHAATVKCPTLLILGQRDQLTPARSVTRLTDAMPHADTTILAGSGHSLLAERPDPVLDQLIRIV